MSRLGALFELKFDKQIQFFCFVCLFEVALKHESAIQMFLRIDISAKFLSLEDFLSLLARL